MAQCQLQAQESCIRRLLSTTLPPPPPMAERTQPLIVTLRRCHEGIPPVTLGTRCLGTSKAPFGVMVCPLPRYAV